MNFELINILVSILAFVGVWLILRPQKVENEALHKSIDNNTAALKELTLLINDLRVEQAGIEQNISNLWHRYRDLKEDIDNMRKCRKQETKTSG